MPNARLIKYLNVGAEFIKVAEENLGKYLNNLWSLNVCFFKKKEHKVRKHKKISLHYNLTLVHQNKTIENQKAGDKLGKHL